jgi:arylsulfatase A-like enzyme
MYMTFCQLLVCVIFLAFATLLPAQTTLPATAAAAGGGAKPQAAAHANARARRAIIISIDGLRPDVLLRANAPRMREMMHDGSFTFWARSTAVSITLPTHVSMLTGVEPQVHGIHWNAGLPLAEPVYPKVSTIFELATKAGYTTGAVAGKSKFDVLGKPGTIDHAYWPDEAKSDDADVAANAQQMLRSHRPEVFFVHFPGVDNVGHKIGWGTPAQLAAVAEADACVGAIRDTLAELKLAEQTLIILTADHGGAGRTHGADDFRSRHIPWIAVGPGVRRNYDLTMNRDLVVETYDTFATVCAMLDIPVSGKRGGKFVEDILEQRELLKSKG